VVVVLVLGVAQQQVLKELRDLQEHKEQQVFKEFLVLQLITQMTLQKALQTSTLQLDGYRTNTLKG
jgi:hypothetical protein